MGEFAELTVTTGGLVTKRAATRAKKMNGPLAFLNTLIFKKMCIISLRIKIIILLSNYIIIKFTIQRVFYL